MNVEPGERLAEDMAVGKCALSAWTGRQIVQPPLQTDNLPEPIDVAARNRQFAEAWTGCAAIRQMRRRTGFPPRSIGRDGIHARRGPVSLPQALRGVASLIVRASSVQRDSQRRQQAPEQDRIAQGIRRRLETPAIGVERGQRSRRIL